MDDKYFTGYDVGCLVMKSWVPKPPGHISCASNYDFPIYYQPVQETNNSKIHGGNKDVIPNIISASKELRDYGCKSLVTSCGYFGHYQKIVADMDILPTYFSTICLIPFVLRMLRPNDDIILVCYNKEKLTSDLLFSCGVSEEQLSRIHIFDIINEKELGRIIKDCGEYNVTEARNEVVNVVVEAVRKYNNIGAILLECTDLPPHSYAIQDAVNLPVFDVTTMIKFIQSLNC